MYNRIADLSQLMLQAEELVGDIRRDAENDLYDKMLDLESDIQGVVADIQDVLNSLDKSESITLDKQEISSSDIGSLDDVLNSSN